MRYLLLNCGAAKPHPLTASKSYLLTAASETACNRSRTTKVCRTSTPCPSTIASAQCDVATPSILQSYHLFSSSCLFPRRGSTTQRRRRLERRFWPRFTSKSWSLSVSFTAPANQKRSVARSVGLKSTTPRPKELQS